MNINLFGLDVDWRSRDGVGRRSDFILARFSGFNPVKTIGKALGSHVVPGNVANPSGKSCFFVKITMVNTEIRDLDAAN